MVAPRRYITYYVVIDMTCKKCKKEIPDDAKYCQYCGTSQANKPKTRRVRGNGLGTVYKEGARWTAEVTLGWDMDGKRIPRKKRGFATKKAAMAYLPELRHHTTTAKVPQDIVFIRLFERLIERHIKRGKSKSTIGCYNAAVKYYQDIYYLPFVDLSTEDFQLCVDDCPRGRRTKENMKAVGTLLYDYAHELKLTGENYAKHIWIPHEDTESRQNFPADILDIIRAGAERGVPHADYILCLCYLGLRPTELFSMDKSAYDPERKTLRGGIKTDAGKNRIVTVSPKIQQYVDRLYMHSGEYLFPRDDGAMLTDSYFRTQYFYPALETMGIQPIPKAGEKPRYTPYSCRHTFATLLKNVPGANKDKAALMGHTTYKMTMHYQHEDYDSLRAITDAI